MVKQEYHPYQRKVMSTNELIMSINSPYQAADATILIRASDNLLFRVHSYRLMNSSVFREMLSINHTSSATTDTIELTDCAIENSHTIRLMLDMMYATPIERPPDSYLPYLVPAVELMKKYDCDTALELLRRNLRIWAADTRIPAKIEIFSAAAHLNDVDTCCLAIHRGGNLKRGTSGKVNAYGANLNLDLGMTNANNFDLAGMSQGELERMPKKYMLALLRATKGVDLASLASQPEWFNIAESFRSFVGTDKNGKNDDIVPYASL